MRATWLQHTSTFSGRKYRAWQNLFNPLAKGTTRSKSWEQKPNPFKLKIKHWLFKSIIIFFSHQREWLTIKTNHRWNGASSSTTAALCRGSMGISKGEILGLISLDLGVLCFGSWDLYTFARQGTAADISKPYPTPRDGKVCHIAACRCIWSTLQIMIENYSVIR